MTIFAVTILSHDHEVAIAVRGELDIATIPHVEHEVDAAFLGRARPYVILDLSDLTFMDSTGLRYVMACYLRACEHGGWLALVNPQPQVLRLLRITMVDTRIPVFESILDAIESRRSDGAQLPSGARTQSSDGE